MDSIKVAIKVRPLIKRETDENLPIQWTVQDNAIAPIDPELKKRGEPFYFDHIFDTHTTNYDVFNVIAKPIVDAAINGINGTIFAYGQTSSGKTFTMMGERDNPGVIPLAIDYIFDRVTSIYDREFLIRVSYIEIYNEKVNDLLDKNGIDLKIKEEKSGQASVMCKEEVANSSEYVLGVMRKGIKNRRIGETNMNDKSSRSHTIFRIIIESREAESDGVVQISQLNLVDLAGSERPKQTGATGDRFNEGRHINLSLSALGLVIMQLSEIQENPQKFVNFRDSKLTRILQASLGGNAMTTIICAVTPAALEETQCTLAFASRAKRIKNKPQVNECVSETALLKRYVVQLAKLKNELAEARGVNFAEMESKLLEKETKLEERNRAYQLLEERIELLKTRILSGNSTPDEEKFKRRSRRRRTWCGPGTFQTKQASFQSNFGLPTITELEKTPEKRINPEHKKRRQSIIQSLDIPNQTFQTAFTDFELELIECERSRNRLSDGSTGGEEDFQITARPHRAVKFMDDVAIIGEELGSPERSPKNKSSEPESPETPKAVLRTRMNFLMEQYNALTEDHRSLEEFTHLEKQMFVEDAVEKAMAEHRKTVDKLEEALAASEKSRRELFEKYTELQCHSTESDKRLIDLQRELTESSNSLRRLENEKERMVEELNKSKTKKTATALQTSGGVTVFKETSSIFANNTYFDEMNDSDPQCDSILTNDTQNMESLVICDTSLVNNSMNNKSDDSKLSKDKTNGTYCEFIKQIGEKSSDELACVMQDLFNAKISLEEENIKLEATLRQKIRESDDVKNDIRELKSGIEKLQETIQLLTIENTDLTSKLTNEKDNSAQTGKSLQSTIAELNSSIQNIVQEKIAMEKSAKEMDEKSKPASSSDESTSNKLEEYKKTIDSLTAENEELSSSLISKIEELDRLKEVEAPSADHECAYRQLTINLSERNKLLENENIELSNNVMDRTEEYDRLKEQYETLLSKLSSLPQQEKTYKLVDVSINRTNLLVDDTTNIFERTESEFNTNPNSIEIEKAGSTIDDLLRFSLPANSSVIDKIDHKEDAAVKDLLRMSIPVEPMNRMICSSDEKIEDWKLKAEMLEEQVENLTLLNEKLRDLKATSCKQCAHLIELRDNRKMLQNEVKTLNRTLEDLQTKFEREFADTEILREKASEDLNLSVADASFNASTSVDGSVNVSHVEERVQSLHNEIESLKTKHEKLTNLYREKCDEIEKLQDTSLRESTPPNIESPRIRRDDSKLERIQTEMDKLQNDLRRCKKSIGCLSSALQKFTSQKTSMLGEIEALKKEKREFEEMLKENKPLANTPEKCESIRDKIITAHAKRMSCEVVEENFENEKSIRAMENQPAKTEERVSNERTMEEKETLSVEGEKIQTLETEVARLSSEIANYEIMTEELKKAKLLLDSEVETLKLGNDDLQEKMTGLESSVAEVTRLRAEMKDFETAKEELESVKLYLETKVRSLEAAKEEEKLTASELLAKKDEMIESSKTEITRLKSQIDDSNAVINQLEDSKSSLETRVESLKIDKATLEEISTRDESVSQAEEKIRSLEKEIVRLTGEIKNSNAKKQELEDAKSWLESKVESLKTENEALEKKMSEKENSSEAEEKIELLENEVSRLISEIESANSASSQLDKIKSSLSSEIDLLKTERNITAEMIEELQRTLKNHEENNSTLKSALETLSSENNEIMSSLEARNKDVESLEENVKILGLKLQDTVAELQKYVDINAELEKRLERAKIKEEQLIAEKTSLEAKIQVSHAEKTSLEANEGTLTEMLNQLQNENSTLSKLSEALETKLEEATNDLNECNKDNVELKMKFDEFERLANETSKEKIILTNEIVNLRAEIKNLQEGISSLTETVRILEENKSSMNLELSKSQSHQDNGAESDESSYKTPRETEEVLDDLKQKLQEITEELRLNSKERLRMKEELTKLDAAREESNAARLALEARIEKSKMEKQELSESLENLRETLRQSEVRNESLEEEMKALLSAKEKRMNCESHESTDSENFEKTIESLTVKLEELNKELEKYSAENDALKGKINDARTSDSTVFKKGINGLSEIEDSSKGTPSILSHEKYLRELESARKSIRKEILSLKPTEDVLYLDEKSTSELFAFFVTTIMSKEREVIKALNDNFEKEKRRLEENTRQSIDAEKRASVWAKELEAEIERTQQDTVLQEAKNAELLQKIARLENLLMESNHENEMLNEKMKVLEADFNTLQSDLEKSPDSRQRLNSSQEKEKLMRESVDTRELELSSKLRLAEKRYKEKLEELTSNLEYQKSRNIDLSNNLEGLEANERQLKNIVDMRTSELARSNSAIESMKKELDATTESYEQSIRENAQNTAKIEEITNLLKSKCDKLSEYKTKLETIMPEYEKLKDHATERQLRLEKCRSEIESLTTESEINISSLKDRLDSEEIKSAGYRKQLAELTNRNTSLQMELVELRTKCAELEITNEKLVKSMRNSTSKIRAEEEMEDLRDRNRTLERNLDGAGNRINELQEMKTRLMKDLMDLRVEHEATSTENEELKSVLSSHRSSVADTIELREKYDECLQQKNRLEMELVDKRSRFAQMEKMVAESERKNVELTRKNAELDAEMDDIVLRIEELTKENSQLDDKLYASENSVASHEAKIKELITRNNDLEAKLENFTEVINDLKSRIAKSQHENETGAEAEVLTNESSEPRRKLSQLDRGDSFSCGESERSSSPAGEFSRAHDRRRRSRNELFNMNRPLEVFENENESGECRCQALKKRYSQLEKELALKDAKIGTLELKIQSEIFPHQKKCKDLEEILVALTRKNKSLKSEIKNLEDSRAQEMSRECERCRQWRTNKRDQASQCMPESTPIFMSGTSSGIIDGHIKVMKLEKDKKTLKTLCRNRQERIFELEYRLKELEKLSGTENSRKDEKPTIDSSVHITSSKPDSASVSRQAMKENVPAIWENQKQPSYLRRDWFN